MFLLSNGDLRQMADQERFLRGRGVNVEQVDVYPAFKTEQEYISALSLLYRSCINGWWNYGDKLIKYGICTAEEFQKKLKNSLAGELREKPEQPVVDIYTKLGLVRDEDC